MIVHVLEAARSGGAHISSPSGGSIGPAAFVDLRWLTVSDASRPERGPAGTSRREWLYTHPPAEVSVDVLVPPVGPGRRVWFSAALAFDPVAWTAPVGDGVRYQVLVTPLDGNAPSGAGETKLDVIFNPRAYVEQRAWVPVEADLTRWAGRRIRLTLRTGPRDDPSNDWSGWANPVLYVRDTARDREPARVPHN